ncbi:MAG: AbrB/MazE/SpoVT family DNA-binding domain-containing protein [Anaerolineae bacterium]|nr:AbrB/MazE/SpoVT family DNA-binding domain-containing protein [Anaerolineae bacterium]NUQ06331.1 AbrB/MazE/SpoVT family DNA-binding domain-containing protein [Anaerolineae bacterium]
MRGKIQQWGRSLVVRIPESILNEAGLEAGGVVVIQALNGQIHIVPVQDDLCDLDTLLSGVTSDNLHDEIEL